MVTVTVTAAASATDSESDVTVQSFFFVSVHSACSKQMSCWTSDITLAHRAVDTAHARHSHDDATAWSVLGLRTCPDVNGVVQRYRRSWLHIEVSLACCLMSRFGMSE
jgi:hypothetical protein